MHNPDTELLFPIRVIKELRHLRGKAWQDLVDEVSTDSPGPVKQIAFVLMMTRQCNCMTCDADSFRAMKGCTQCAQQTIRRSKGGDDTLIKLFKQALLEYENYREKMQV